MAEVLGDVGNQVVAERVRIPLGPREQVLDAVGPLVADVLGQLPGVLALDGAEEAAEVRPGSSPRLGAGEGLPQSPGHVIQLIGPSVDRLDSRKCGRVLHLGRHATPSVRVPRPL